MDFRPVRPRLNGLVKSAALALLLALPAQALPAAAQETLPVQHAQGTTPVPRNPQRVVVYDMAALDTLDALGVKVAGVPGGVLPGYLSKYASGDTPKVGTLFEPDFEAVAALEPDLIIVGGRSAAKYRDLAKLAPTIDLTTDTADFMASVTRNVETVGRIFGKEAEAAQRLAALRQSIEAVRATAAGAGKGLLVLTTGGKMSAYGPGSRFGVLHTLFGVTPAVPDLQVSLHGQSISPEFILKTDPDWLFVIDRDAAIGQGAAAPAVLNNELVARTKAWKAKQVVTLDSTSWYLSGGGLTATKAMIDQLAAVLKSAG